MNTDRRALYQAIYETGDSEIRIWRGADGTWNAYHKAKLSEAATKRLADFLKALAES